jgi:hypothetical protein
MVFLHYIAFPTKHAARQSRNQNTSGPGSESGSQSQWAKEKADRDLPER